MRTSCRNVRSFFMGAMLVLGATSASFHLSADTIAVIGTGNVAGALGPEFAQQGHDIIYGSRSPDRADVVELVARTGGKAFATTQVEAATQAEIVVLAIPGDVAESVVASLGDLSGKIIIDPTNRVGPSDDGFMSHTTETSNAELIQALVPDAYVVKAFNTLGFRTMIDPESSGGPVSIPIVGNNDAAKARVATLIEGMDLVPIDLGPVRYAHVIEGMLVVWINGIRSGTPFNYYLRPQEQ